MNLYLLNNNMETRRLSQERKNVLISYLKQEEEWNADAIISISQLLIQNAALDCDQFCLIDPGQLSLVIDNPPSYINWTRNCEIIKKLLNNNTTHVVLLPIFHARHWSLLIYLTHHKQWIHCDPKKDLHKQRIIHIQRILHQYNIVDARQRHCIFLGPLPEQESNYECGQYTVLYIDVIIKQLNLLKSIMYLSFMESVRTSLCEVNENNRRNLLYSVENIIKSF